MSKEELDVEFARYYSKFIFVATGACIRSKRAYSAEDCVSELYLHLMGKMDKIDKEKGIHNYGVSWLSFTISKERSCLNLGELKGVEYADYMFGRDGGEDDDFEGSEIDRLKEKIKKCKKSVKNRVNFLFLQDISGDTDFTKKTLAEYYDISVRGVGSLVKSVSKELMSINK